MSDSSKKKKTSEQDTSAGNQVPDWMRMAASETGEDSQTEEGTPDWLKSIKAGQSSEGTASEGDDLDTGMSDLERLLAEEGIDLGSVQDDLPEGAVGMSARDWLIETSDDELIRSRRKKQEDVDLSLAETPKKAAPPAETSTPPQAPPIEATPEADTDDPFAGMSDLERMLAEEGIDLTSVADDLPPEAQGMSARDFLLTTSDDEMIRKRVAQQEEVDLSLATPAPAKAAAPPSPTPEPPAAPPASAEPPADDPFAGMSDLERMLAEEGIDPTSVTDEIPAEAQGMSARDFLLSTSEDEMIRKRVGKKEEVVDLEVTPQATPPVAEAPSEVDDDLPDWLQESTPSDTVAAPPSVKTSDDIIEDDDELPDWLLEATEDEEDKGEVVAHPPSADADDDMMVVDDELPDWLLEDEEDETVAQPPSDADDDMMVVDDELPDWLRDEEALGDTFGDDEPSPPPAEIAEPSEEADELPDWLQEEDEEKPEPVAVPPTAEPTEEMAADDDDLPDWLQEEDEAEAVPPADAATDADDDMMVVEDDLPDWLQEEDEAETPTPSLTPPAVEQEGDMMVVEDDLPDWLQEEDEAETPTPSLTPPAVEQEGDMMVVEDDLPDWLRDDDAAETVPPPPSVTEPTADGVSDDDDDDLPDWLLEEYDQTTPPAGATTDVDDDMMVVEDDLPDWLQDVSDTVTTPESAISAPAEESSLEEEMPDWLQDVADETASTVPDTDIEPVSDSPAGEEVDELPDWLQSDEDAPEDIAFAPSVEEESLTDVEGRGSDLPDWLQDIQEEETSDLTADLVLEADQAEDAPVPEEDLPDWLRDIQDDTSLEMEEVTAEVEEVVTGMPSWLQEAQESEAEETDLDLSFESELEAEEEEADLFGEEFDEEEPIEEKFEEEEADLFGEEFDEEEPIEEKPAEEKQPELVAEAAAEPEPEVEPEPEPALELDIEPEIVAPVPVAAETTPAPVPVMVYDGELPPWLHKLREGDQRVQQTTQLGVLSIPVPIPVAPPVLTAQTLSQTALPSQTQPVYQAQPITRMRAEPDAAATETFETARNAYQKGDLEKALPAYEELVKNGVYLGQIIDDMQKLVTSHSENYRLFQIMGDAMLRDGRIQSALEAYRQGLSQVIQLR